MPKIKHYIQAARLRTLPLSLSGIFMGTAMAAKVGKFNLIIFILALFTTIGFQVLSNFANDYGDGIKGTDKDREGEERLVASGKISLKQMKRAMFITIAITLLFAIALIYVSFKNDFITALVFFILGIASIVAAIKYTVGSNAYGYSGMGDFFVFIFFGFLGVVGSYYLFTKDLADLWVWLPATAIGLLSTAVLNLNNMRDQINDKKASKNTLVVKLGSQKAKKYHYFLLVTAMLLLVLYQYNQSEKLLFNWLFMIAFIPLFLNIVAVAKNIIFSELDSELKKVALSTFLISILFFINSFVS